MWIVCDSFVFADMFHSRLIDLVQFLTCLLSFSTISRKVIELNEMDDCTHYTAVNRKFSKLTYGFNAHWHCILFYMPLILRR